MTLATLSADELRGLPAVIDVPTAAAYLVSAGPPPTS